MVPTPHPDVPVGRISGSFGVRGELKCDPTSAGRIVFTPGAELRCALGATSTTIRLSSVRPHQDRFLIGIEGVDDLDAAKPYVGAILHASRDRIALDPGEYLDMDLEGCRVYGRDGTDYGAVEAVEHYPSSDMLVVAGVLVPMVGACVIEVDVAQRRIIIDPPAGLFE
jgi:16S rRNA processing protein RimM